jgi:hypothetical protein
LFTRSALRESVLTQKLRRDNLELVCKECIVPIMSELTEYFDSELKRGNMELIYKVCISSARSESTKYLTQELRRSNLRVVCRNV